MTALALSGGVTVTDSQGGQTIVTQATAATLDSSVVLYTTEISGSLLGVQVDYTPANPPSSLPSNLQLTGVVAHDAITTADTALITALHTAVG